MLLRLWCIFSLFLNVTIGHKTSHKGVFNKLILTLYIINKLSIEKNYHFDAYIVLLAIAINIPVVLMTSFVVQGHTYNTFENFAF